jgi:predicted transcriptional regulator
MAKLISLKQVEDERYVYEIELSRDEADKIDGSIKDLIIFSENELVNSDISSRGKMGRTKYFLIPKELRKRINLSDKKVICQRLDIKNKTFFIYAVNPNYCCN